MTRSIILAALSIAIGCGGQIPANPAHDAAPVAATGCPCGCKCSDTCGCGCVDGGKVCDCSTVFELPLEVRHLPCEKTCERNFHLATAWHQELSETAILAGGWRAECLRNALQDAEIRKNTWYACWWATWPKAIPESRDYWSGQLRAVIGEPAYLAGILPGPLP